MTTTCGNLCDRVKRRLTVQEREQFVVLSENLVAGATSITVTDPTNGPLGAALRPGTVIEIDLELFRILSTSTGGTGSATLTVAPGQLGTTEASHTSGTLIGIEPRFPMKDIFDAINDDLADLSGMSGLYQVGSLDITYNPVYSAYDLPIPTGFLDILEVRFKHPYPDRNRLPIRSFKVIRNQTDAADFPSGQGIILYDDAYPGEPIHITYKAPFTPFTSLTDDCQAVAGLATTMNDLPPLGASIALISYQEPKRNFTSAQPDPRKALEVPPGAVMNSVAGLIRSRQSRIAAEAARLYRQHEQDIGARY